MRKELKRQRNETETIRIAIELGIVASCLGLFSIDFAPTLPWLNSAVKISSIVYGVVAMSYVILTARVYGYKWKYDLKIRQHIYDFTVDMYWIFMMAFLFEVIRRVFNVENWIYYLLLTIDILLAVILIVFGFSRRKR